LLEGGKLESLILDTIRELAENGIDPGTIAASMNTVEFRLRENNTGAFPRGLLLMLRALTAWLYGGDPIDPLAFEEPLQAIKERLVAGEAFFEAMLRSYFLENPHITTVIMQPVPGLNQRLEAAEQEKLAHIKAGMNQDQLRVILENTQRLKRLQETPDPPQALASLPRLGLQDLEKRNKPIPLEISNQRGCRILYHDLFTNGILYLDLGFDLRALPQELLPFVRLFARALLETSSSFRSALGAAQAGSIHRFSPPSCATATRQPPGCSCAVRLPWSKGAICSRS
jgi:Zn-dependent M16 (insulinase) family peptidase